MKMRNEQNWVTHIMGCWEYNITLVEALIKWRAWPSRCSSLRRLIYHLHSVDYSRVWVYFKHITWLLEHNMMTASLSKLKLFCYSFKTRHSWFMLVQPILRRSNKSVFTQPVLQRCPWHTSSLRLTWGWSHLTLRSRVHQRLWWIQCRPTRWWRPPPSLRSPEPP